MRNKFLGKLNDSLSIHLLVVNDSQISTKNLAILYIDVFKADKTYLKHKQPSTQPFFMYFTRTILHSRYSSYWFQISLGFFGHAVRVNKPFSNFIQAFFLTDTKIQEEHLLIFYFFLKFALLLLLKKFSPSF